MKPAIVVAAGAFLAAAFVSAVLYNRHVCPEALFSVPPAPPHPIHACFNTSDVFPKSSPLISGLDKIYVIHWSKLQERKTLMTARLSAVLPSSWQQKNFVAFVVQYDGDKLQLPQEMRCIAQDYAQNLTRGVLSVTTKHFVAYHDIVMHGYSAALIMEDDADFSAGAVGRLEQVLVALPSRWSNCFVSGCMGNASNYVHSCGEGLVCKQPLGIGSNCAYGYLISQRGAQQMLATMPVRTTPDFQMNYAATWPSFHTYMSNQVTNILFENATGIQDGTWQPG